jgi:hypothetical protein
LTNPIRPAGAIDGRASVRFDPEAGELARSRAGLARLVEDYERIVELAEENSEQQEAVKARIKRLEKADRPRRGRE